jgi:hypothetical protein
VTSFDEVIPPGQVGQIAAKLDTVSLHGEIGRGITVRTDDPARPSLFLTVRARVVGGVRVQPEEGLQLQNADGRPARASAVVSRDPGEPGDVAVHDVRLSVPWLRAEVERVTEPRPAADGAPGARPGDWVIQVAPDPTAPYGRSRAELRFATGLAGQREVALPVLVFIEPPVRLSTDRLGLSGGAGAPASSETVLLTVRRGLDPAALEIETRPDSLRVRLEPSGPRAFKLHVEWQGAGEPRGEILFRVGSESYALPVYSKSGAG